MVTDGIFTILGYLLGSMSSAVIVCRLAGLPDPRTQGSHNPGATNVLRIGGKRAAALTLGGDFLKGLIPVLVATLCDAGEVGVAGAGLGAFLGHLYPIFFGFKGGKGVATSLGVVLGLSPWVALAALCTWIVVAVATRISSLAALIAAVLSPIYLWLFDLPTAYVVSVLMMVILLVWRHRSNIEKLIAGTESRIGDPKNR